MSFGSVSNFSHLKYPTCVWCLQSWKVSEAPLSLVGAVSPTLLGLWSIELKLLQGSESSPYALGMWSIQPKLFNGS